MTPAELKTLRESLGLTAQWLADQSRVKLRTAQYWESGRMRVPQEVADMLIHIDRQFAETVACELLKYTAQRRKPESVVLIRYRSDSDLWQFRKDMEPLPASSYATLIDRIRQGVVAMGCPVRIIYMEPDAYLSWLCDRKDTEMTRLEWANTATRVACSTTVEDDLRERVIWLVNNFAAVVGKYAYLEELTGITARKWKNMCNRVTYPSNEMLSALAILQPEFISWMICGRASAVSQVQPACDKNLGKK